MRNNVILLVGPSGAGKSTIIKRIGKLYDDITILQTDVEIKNKLKLRHASDATPEVLFAEAKLLLEGLVLSAKSPVLIDIGAGSLGQNVGWFKQFYRICIMNDDYETLWQRRKRHHDTFDSYASLELNEARKSLYETSHYKVDTRRTTPSEATKLVYKYIHMLLE